VSEALGREGIESDGLEVERLEREIGEGGSKGLFFVSA
jgi:hypothetical protein